MNLSLYDNKDIFDLFTEKNWDIDDKNKSSLIYRFIKFYGTLNEDEKKLFLKLSRQFKLVPLSSYQDSLISLIENIYINYFSKKQTVYIYPMKKKIDERKLKSSDMITYLTQGKFMKYLDALSKKNIIIINGYEELSSKSNQIIKQNHSIIILDDFIGSGKYAYDVIEEVSSLKIPSNNIIIGTLYITNQGFKKLSDKKLNISFVEKISSCTDSLTNKEKNILQNIETSLNIDDEFKFGYGESACLISLIRTPNNTLPMFWSNKKNSPFPR